MQLSLHRSKFLSNQLSFGTFLRNYIKMSELKTLGAAERISFPKLNISDIPARIDTGAKSSSIHAVDIKTITKNGKTLLTFKLSPNGKTTWEVEDFSVRTVKSSNGEFEQRYVVQLTVRIAGKNYKTDFTLTDRSQMNFPVLIGRRLLKNRFVVDVSRKEEDNPKNSSTE